MQNSFANEFVSEEPVIPQITSFHFLRVLGEKILVKHTSTRIKTKIIEVIHLQKKKIYLHFVKEKSVTCYLCEIPYCFFLEQPCIIIHTPKPENRKKTHTYLALCLKPPAKKNTKQGVNKQGGLRGQKTEVTFAQYGTFKRSDLLLLLHSYQIHIKKQQHLFTKNTQPEWGRTRQSSVMCAASFTFWHKQHKQHGRTP